MCTMIGCTSYVNTGHSGYENESGEKFLKVIDTSNLITLKVFLINTTKLIKRVKISKLETSRFVWSVEWGTLQNRNIFIRSESKFSIYTQRCSTQLLQLLFFIIFAQMAFWKGSGDLRKYL